jgi:methyl-accepting chemotaxis protein PixJ
MGKNQKAIPLQKSLLTAILPAVLIPLAIGGALGAILQYQEANKEANAELRNNTLLSAELASEQLQNATQAIELVAKNPLVIDAARTGATRAATEKLNTLPIEELEKRFKATKLLQPNTSVNNYLTDVVRVNGLAEVFFTERNGFNIAYSNPTSDFVQRDENWWQEAQKAGASRVLIGAVEFDESSKSFSVELEQAITDLKTGEFLGAIKGGLSTANLVKLLTKVLAGEFTENSSKLLQIADIKNKVVVVSATGEKITSASDQQLEGGDFVWQKATEILQQNSSSTAEQDPIAVFAHAGKQYTLAKVPGIDWVAITSINQSEIQAAGNRLALNIALVVLTVGAIVTGIVVVLARQFSAPLQRLTSAAELVASGDSQTLTNIEGTAEMQTLAQTFNKLNDRVSGDREKLRQEIVRTQQMQEQIEADSTVLQEEVGQLLDTVLAVEDGDLTIQAPVSDRVTGLVSDSFNRLIEQLTRIMAAVSSTTQQVSQNALNVEQLAIRTAQQVQKQTQSVDGVQALMQSINDLTQDNARQTQIANESIQQAQKSVLRGQQQMTQLNQEVDTLGQGADLINKRVQNLNDFVQLAVQFAKDQRRISSMTRVLSLNASLLSTRATEQQDPEQFASIAREFETIATQVNDLAVQTSQSLIVLQQRTDQIQTVVSGLNQDAQEINQIIKDFTTGTAQSRQIFDEIRTATEQVAQVEQQVAQSSIAIAETVDTTLKSIQEIAALASDTEQQVNVTREQSETMEKVARDLYELVRFFRIAPEQIQAVSESNSLPPASTNGKHNSEDLHNSTDRKVVQEFRSQEKAY